MTEKNYNPDQKAVKAMKKQPKQNFPKVIEVKPKQEEEKINPEELKEILKEEMMIDEKIEKEQEKVEEKKTEEKKEEQKEKSEEKKEKKKEEIKKPAKKIKKEEVCVNGHSVVVSTKYAFNLCKFIKGKRIGDAIRDLEQVTLLKKSVPMKGEYSHRKGRGMSGGAYPQKAAKEFIILLKSLAANAENHEINEPVICEAFANWAPAPKGKFGRIRRKRTHVTLKAREMKSHLTNSSKGQVREMKIKGKNKLEDKK
jgi:ribosomal protein L22